MSDVLVRIEFASNHLAGCHHQLGQQSSRRVVCFGCFVAAREREAALPGAAAPDRPDGGLVEARRPLAARDLEHRRRMLNWLRQA
jgi:hypothetical protein